MEHHKILIITIALSVLSQFSLYFFIDNIFTSYLLYFSLQISLFIFLGVYYLLVSKIVSVLIDKGYWETI